VATNLRLKWRGHWDRPYLNLGLPNSHISLLLRRKEVQKVMLQTLLHGETYPDFDVWWVSCEALLNLQQYEKC
jgi:hypothetical protein